MDSDDKKITQLTKITALSDSDLFLVSIDTGTAPKSRAIPLSEVKQEIDYSYVIGSFLNGATVPLSTTYYACPYKTTADATAHTLPWPQAGVLSNMAIRLSSTQPASGSLVCTLQINAVDAALAITIAAGSAAGTYSDTTHSVTIAATDRISWKIVNNSGAAVSAALTSITMILTNQVV